MSSILARCALPALGALVLALGLVGAVGAAPTPTAEACRRVAESEAVPDALVERCRAFLDEQAPPAAGPHAVCRRVAAADAPAVGMVERCRHWLGVDGGPSAAEACRRFLGHEVTLPASIVERCRALFGETLVPALRPDSGRMPVADLGRRV